MGVIEVSGLGFSEVLVILVVVGVTLVLPVTALLLVFLAGRRRGRAEARHPGSEADRPW